MIQISVIVPTLNEERTISQCIARVRALDPDVELIIADGGSEDRTVAVAQENGVVVTCSARGRGRQLNVGAARASGALLLFLHADTELPSDAFRLLDESFGDDRVQIGTFRVAFDVNHWLLDFYGRLSRFDSVITRYGDQCIAVRKAFFESLGGFPEWPLFEDVHLLRMARKRGPIHFFHGTVTTSARRFVQTGVVRQILRDGWYVTQYLLGMSPERLAAKYQGTKGNPNSISLIIFARFPRPGRVKTRLATSLGDKFATDFYKLCAEHTFKMSGKVFGDVQRYLFCSDKGDIEAVRRWVGRRFFYASQIDGDLGQRMEHAFTTAFSHGATKAIILATDVPDLSAEIVGDAIRALDSCDVVVGPCPDGGYYLFGMKRLYTELFTGISWGTELVLDETRAVIQALGLTVHQVPSLMDIDTEAALRRWSMAATRNPHHPLRHIIRSLDSTTAMDKKIETGSV